MRPSPKPKRKKPYTYAKSSYPDAGMPVRGHQSPHVGGSGSKGGAPVSGGGGIAEGYQEAHGGNAAAAAQTAQTNQTTYNPTTPTASAPAYARPDPRDPYNATSPYTPYGDITVYAQQVLGLTPSEARIVPMAVGAGQKYGVSPALLMGLMENQSGLKPRARIGDESGLGMFGKKSASDYGVKEGDDEDAIRSQVNGLAEMLSDSGVNDDPRGAIAQWARGEHRGFPERVLKTAEHYEALDNPSSIGQEQSGPVNTERPLPTEPVRRDPSAPNDGPVNTERPAPEVDPDVARIAAAVQRRVGEIADGDLQAGPTPAQKQRIRDRLERAVRKADPQVPAKYDNLGPASKELAEAAVKYGKEFGISPSFLMGIAEIETGFGAAAGSGTAGSGAVSSAGAQGYMQFMPASRDAVLKATGYDAFSKDPKEAMAAAAGYFSVFAPDAKSDWDRAYSYNHAGWYADDVTANAEKYRDLDNLSAGKAVNPDLKQRARSILGKLNTQAIVKDIDTTAVRKIGDPEQRRAVKSILVTGKVTPADARLLGPAAAKALADGGEIVHMPKGGKGPADSAADELRNGMIVQASKKQLKHFSIADSNDRAWFDPILMRQLIKLSKATGEPITLNSGFRTLDEQKAAYADFQAGGALAATPGSSNHEYGLAADISLTSAQRARLAEFGLGLPVGGEDWHVEVVDPNLMAQQTARNLGTTSDEEPAPTGPKIKGTNLHVVKPPPEASTGATGTVSGAGAPLSSAGSTWTQRDFKKNGSAMPRVPAQPAGISATSAAAIFGNSFAGMNPELVPSLAGVLPPTAEGDESMIDLLNRVSSPRRRVRTR